MRASTDRIFAHLGRVEYLPRYGAPLWMAAESIEKRRNAHVVALTGYLIGLPVESVLRIVVRPPHALEFKQVRGTLRALGGQCSLRAVEDGTEVYYRLEVDPGIAMISDEAARQFLVQFVERMLDRVKLAAERRVPARRAERAGAPAALGLDAGDDDAEPDLEGGGPLAIHEAPEAGPLPAEAVGTAAPPSPAPERAPAAPFSGGGAAAQVQPGRTASSRPGRRRRRRHRGRPRPSAPSEGGASPAR